MPDAGRHALLERELRALGRDLGAQLGDVDLSGAVARRLAEPSAPTPLRRSGRRRRVVIALVAAVGVMVTVALPSARAAINRVFDIGAVTITDEPPPVTLLTGGLRLGERVTIEDARARMPIAVPTGAGLGAPDEVWFNTIAGGQASLVYRGDHGVELLVQEFVADGHEVIGKYIRTDTQATPVTIDGGEGVFLSGAEHAVFYLDPTGAYEVASGRLVGNALIFQRGALTIRIEGDLSQGRMIEIAESLR